jgi:hypothetical protein
MGKGDREPRGHGRGVALTGGPEISSVQAVSRQPSSIGSLFFHRGPVAKKLTRVTSMQGQPKPS